jgi:hypothetical protein
MTRSEVRHFSHSLRAPSTGPLQKLDGGRAGLPRQRAQPHSLEGKWNFSGWFSLEEWSSQQQESDVNRHGSPQQAQEDRKPLIDQITDLAAKAAGTLAETAVKAGASKAKTAVAKRIPASIKKAAKKRAAHPRGKSAKKASSTRARTAAARKREASPKKTSKRI